jgi:hypothetical protein
MDQNVTVLRYRVAFDDQNLPGTRMVETFTFGMSGLSERWSDVEACKSILVTVTYVVSVSHFHHQVLFLSMAAFQVNECNATQYTCASMLDANPHVYIELQLRHHLPSEIPKRHIRVPNVTHTSNKRVGT